MNVKLNIMFLDDELLKMCEDYNGTTPEEVQRLNVDICKKCEDYYKSKINMTLSNKEVKVILNKTFNLFDSFVRMAKKSKTKKTQLLGGMFEKFSFKLQFLENKEMAIFYMNL